MVRFLSHCSPSFPEMENTPGSQRRFTVTIVLSPGMWGTFVVVASTCCSPQVAHWGRAGWASMFPLPSNHWMSDLLYPINLGCLVVFVQPPSRRPGSGWTPPFPRPRKARRLRQPRSFSHHHLDSWSPASASRLN